MKDFKTNLAGLPTIDHLSGLNVLHEGMSVQHIPAVEGKLGSLRVYYALARQFDGKLDRTLARQGLDLFAEHRADAEQNPGKHPNIDLLLRVVKQDLVYQLEPVYKS